ncbi:unnamed protein product [Arabis nemorensis]|uniref:Late embryogenesis abundant protein LEA-2 subgroup domain-containing protein n=1 Tax=Arabis nemorensis TaxID=586526 RepID=A0A565CT08_9BRAS|nr:unnamed protein product [Arabis nemorensis]
MSIFFSLVLHTNSLRCHVDFSVESISVSPSSTATWHVDFLVKDPRSRCPIDYDGDYVYVKLGSLNAVVLNTSHKGRSRGVTSFSVDFATSNQSDFVSASPPRVLELDIKLRAKKKQYVDLDKIGHFDITCQNLMIGHEDIKCDSSFKKLETCC